MGLISGFVGTYTASGGTPNFDVINNADNIKWPSTTGTSVSLTAYDDNAGITNNSTIPLKRVFTFNDVGSPSKAWLIHYQDSTLTRLSFTSTNNTGWVGTWHDRDSQFTIQQTAQGTYTLTRNGNTHNCTFIDATNLTNVMTSFFDSSSQPVVVVLTNSTANGGAISIISNASNGAWTSQEFAKTS